MEVSKDKDEAKEPKYIPPTEREIIENAFAPGRFGGKCRKCKKIIYSHTLQELNRHKCQS